MTQLLFNSIKKRNVNLIILFQKKFLSNIRTLRDVNSEVEEQTTSSSSSFPVVNNSRRIGEGGTTPNDPYGHLSRSSLNTVVHDTSVTDSILTTSITNTEQARAFVTGLYFNLSHPRLLLNNSNITLLNIPNLPSYLDSYALHIRNGMSYMVTNAENNVSNLESIRQQMSLNRHFESSLHTAENYQQYITNFPTSRSNRRDVMVEFFSQFAVDSLENLISLIQQHEAIAPSILLYIFGRSMLFFRPFSDWRGFSREQLGRTLINALRIARHYLNSSRIVSSHTEAVNSAANSIVSQMTSNLEELRENLDALDQRNYTNTLYSIYRMLLPLVLFVPFCYARPNALFNVISNLLDRSQPVLSNGADNALQRVASSSSSNSATNIFIGDAKAIFTQLRRLLSLIFLKK